MLNLILNVIGIILVLYSLYFIRKDILEEKNNKSKTIDMPDYDNNRDFIEGFEEVINSKIQETETDENNEEEIMNRTSENINEIIKEKDITALNDDINPLHKKILELRSLGLSSEDIAKKLGRGIREIDIVLKIHKL